MSDINPPAIKSPWILPPEKAPRTSTSVLLLLSGFVLMIGTIVYNFYSILKGGDFSFMVFMLLMLLATILIMVGAVRFAKAYGSKKYAMLVKEFEQKREQ